MEEIKIVERSVVQDQDGLEILCEYGDNIITVQGTGQISHIWVVG